MRVAISKILLDQERITVEQLAEALDYQRTHGGSIGHVLVKLGYVHVEELEALLRKHAVPSINLSRFEVDPSVVKLIPAETARRHQVVPLSVSGTTLTIAIEDPTNTLALDDIKSITGYNVEPVVATERAVLEAITRWYGSPHVEPKNSPPPSTWHSIFDAALLARCSSEVLVSIIQSAPDVALNRETTTRTLEFLEGLPRDDLAVFDAVADLLAAAVLRAANVSLSRSHKDMDAVYRSLVHMEDKVARL